MKKLASPADGRVTYLSITGKGEELHQKYNEQYFHALASCVKGISEEDALCMIRTIEKFYTIINDLEKEKADLLGEIMNLKQEIRNMKMNAEIARTNSDMPEVTNVDLLRRLSKLEKMVYGKDE